MSTRLKDHRNIGPKSAAWLESVGILTLEDLEELGAVDAYLRVKMVYPEKASLNLLYALQGVLLDLRWDQIPPEMKADLKRQVTDRSLE